VIVATHHALAQRRTLETLLRFAESDPTDAPDRPLDPFRDLESDAALALARRERVAALLYASGLERSAAASLPNAFRAGCESVYLQTLIRNRHAAKCGRRILGAMQAEGIPTAPVDAWALLQTPLRYYPDPGARPLDEIELVVRESDRGRAESLLFAQGFRRTREPARDERDSGSSIFRSEASETDPPLRLRWGWEGFASRAHQIVLRGGDFLDGLCDTTVSDCYRSTRIGDLLVSSLRAARPDAGRWISLADVHRVLGAAPVDWREVTQAARRWRLRSPVYASLVAARRLFGTPIPRTALARLSPGPIRRRLLQRSLAACHAGGATDRRMRATGALLGESWWDIARGAARARVASRPVPDATV